MRNMSIWASRHKWTARLIIVGSFFILNCIGLFLGDVLIASGTLISSIWIYLISFIFIVGFITYPSRKQKKAYKNFYKRQKTSDLLLVSTTFLLIISFGNHYSLPKNQSPFGFTYVNATASTNANTTTIHETTIESSPQKKTSIIKKWRQKIRDNIRTIRREYKDATPGERTALIVLSIIVALGLFFLVLSASCSLSCSGADGAALVVGLLGTGLIVFLLVRVIKRINRGEPKKPKTPEPQTTSA
jgi:hypothetical protein